MRLGEEGELYTYSYRHSQLALEFKAAPMISRREEKKREEGKGSSDVFLSARAETVTREAGETSLGWNDSVKMRFAQLCVSGY